MMYRRMCICDVEPVYLRKLAAYLNRHPGFLWRIKTAVNLDGCLRDVPEVLIVSGAALTEYGRSGMSEKLLEDAGCQIILLEDDSGCKGGWPTINKYQSAKRFYEDLLEILGGEGSGSAEIIGVYGPSSGPEAEQFAVQTAKERKKTGRCCLFPLRNFPHFRQEIQNKMDWVSGFIIKCRDRRKEDELVIGCIQRGIWIISEAFGPYMTAWK